VSPVRVLSARVRRRRVAGLAAAVSGAVLVSCAAARGGAPQAPVAVAVPAAPGASGKAPSRAAAPAAVYAHTGVGMLTPVTSHVPYLLYVPESAGTGVDVVDPVHLNVIGHYTTGLDPQHVVPSYDLSTLWSTNDLANSLTPFDPRTGRPRGPSVAVDDPYNMYFAPGGKLAIVVAEQRQQLEFYDARTFAPVSVTRVDCAGVDHADFDATEHFLVASCEFGHGCCGSTSPPASSRATSTCRGPHRRTSA